MNQLWLLRAVADKGRPSLARTWVKDGIEWACDGFRLQAIEVGKDLNPINPLGAWPTTEPAATWVVQQDGLYEAAHAAIFLNRLWHKGIEQCIVTLSADSTSVSVNARFLRDAAPLATSDPLRLLIWPWTREKEKDKATLLVSGKHHCALIKGMQPASEYGLSPAAPAAPDGRLVVYVRDAAGDPVRLAALPLMPDEGQQWFDPSAIWRAKGGGEAAMT
jgi:hypothetical protein